MNIKQEKEQKIYESHNEFYESLEQALRTKNFWNDGITVAMEYRDNPRFIPEENRIRSIVNKYVWFGPKRYSYFRNLMKYIYQGMATYEHLEEGSDNE